MLSQNQGEIVGYVVDLDTGGESQILHVTTDSPQLTDYRRNYSNS